MSEKTKKEKKAKADERHGLKCQQCGIRDFTVRYIDPNDEDRYRYVAAQMILCTKCEEDFGWDD